MGTEIFIDDFNYVRQFATTHKCADTYSERNMLLQTAE